MQLGLQSLEMEAAKVAKGVLYSTRSVFLYSALGVSAIIFFGRQKKRRTHANESFRHAQRGKEIFMVGLDMLPKVVTGRSPV